ncbi:conserved exported hypothetical protein [Candidatus Sulfopaludibacter sp. SbA3]|nr:conserved exported hypothetical protein [Candidatus Sulfopaludibacter sp. SbA3]
MKTQFAFMLLAASALWGQAQPATAGWKEFSIGPPTRMQAGWPREGIRADGVPLKRAIARAYGVPENRVFGPDWLADVRYAITGIVDNPKDFQPLFQKELANQFHMLAHRESKVVPVFVLKPLDTPAKMGPAVNPGTSTASGSSDGFSSIRYPRATVETFANALGDVVGRPVIDETNLDNSFEFILRWKGGSTSSLQTAVKSQLGLDLSDERRAVDLLVIDHIEKLNFSK